MHEEVAELRVLYGARREVMSRAWRIAVGGALAGVAFLLFWNLYQQVPHGPFYLLCALVIGLVVVRSAVQKLLERRASVTPSTSRALDLLYALIIGVASYLFAAHVFPGSQ